MAREAGSADGPLDPRANVLRAGASGIAEVLREIKTPLILGGLSFFAIVGISLGVPYVLVKESSDRGASLTISALVIAVAAFGLIGFIVYLFARTKQSSAAGLSALTGGLPALPAGVEYDIPSTLLVCRHEDPLPDGAYVFRTLRVSTIRSAIEGDLTVRFLRRSQGEILETESLSHPLTALPYQDGPSSGGSETTLHDAKPGQQFILVEEDHRKLTMEAQERRPLGREDVVRRTLHEKCLLSPRHEYVGTLLNAPTGRARFLIYFPTGLYPSKVEAVKISSSGRIDKDGVRVEGAPDQQLYIIEGDNLQLDSGFFAYWAWPKGGATTAAIAKSAELAYVRGGPRLGEVLSHPP